MRFAEFWKLCSFLSPIESFWCRSFQVLRQTADGSTDPLFPRPYPHCLAFGVSWWEKILKLLPGVKNMHHLMSYMEGIYIVHQSFIWPLRMFYQFWRVNFLSTFYKGWLSMHLRFCKGCNLAQKMSFSNLPCLPFRTARGHRLDLRKKTWHLDVPCPMDGTSMNDSELRMAATPEPAFKGDKPSHPIMDSVKLRNSEFDGHSLSIGNMIFLVEFLWVCM